MAKILQTKFHDDCLLDRFKAFYADLGKADLSQLSEFYGRDVIFRDPVHEIRGLVALEDYFAALMADLDSCRFEYLDELATARGAYIKWVMHFRHSKLGPRTISVRGVTHLLIVEEGRGQRIGYHEDLYDMGAMIYEHLPVIGRVTHWVKRRLAA